MNRHRLILTASLVALLAVLVAAFGAAPADAKSPTNFAGHRCHTWPDRTHTHENTPRAMRVLATAERYGEQVWCEADVVVLADGTNLIWHDPTWGGAADPTSLDAAGVDASDPVSEATWAQARLIKTRGGSPAARLTELIDAAHAYGVGRIVLEHRNGMSNPDRILAYAADRGVSLWFYRVPTGVDCTVEIPGWDGRLGAKLNTGTPCTANRLREQGVGFVSETTIGLLADRGARIEEYQRVGGIYIIARQPTQADALGPLRDHGVRRVLVDNVRKAARTWIR